MASMIDSILSKEGERAGLMKQLEQIARLKERGIIRHDIVKQRKVTRYSHGRNIPTGEADIIMRDGTEHRVPDNLLMWE
jgi:undecaprenyl pyrophosphate synthase